MQAVRARTDQNNVVTKKKIEEMMHRLELGETVTLQERIELHKYARRFQMVAGKLRKILY